MLAPGNRVFVNLFHRMLPGLFDGLGGVRYTAITEVFNTHQVAAGQRPILHDLTLVAVAAIRQLRKDKP